MPNSKIIRATFCIDGNEYQATADGIRRAISKEYDIPRSQTEYEDFFNRLKNKILHTGIYYTEIFVGKELSVGCQYDGDMDADYGGSYGFVDISNDVTLHRMGFIIL